MAWFSSIFGARKPVPNVVPDVPPEQPPEPEPEPAIERLSIDVELGSGLFSKDQAPLSTLITVFLTVDASRRSPAGDLSVIKDEVSPPLFRATSTVLRAIKYDDMLAQLSPIQDSICQGLSGEFEDSGSDYTVHRIFLHHIWSSDPSIKSAQQLALEEQKERIEHETTMTRVERGHEKARKEEEHSAAIEELKSESKLRMEQKRDDASLRMMRSLAEIVNDYGVAALPVQSQVTILIAAIHAFASEGSGVRFNPETLTKWVGAFAGNTVKQSPKIDYEKDERRGSGDSTKSEDGGTSTHQPAAEGSTEKGDSEPQEPDQQGAGGTN